MYHILNGDALKEQFPTTIEGEIIVMRECLIEGPVNATDLSEFIQQRAKFLAESYGGNEKDYDGVEIEIKKINSIPEGAKVFVWFEDDLFCQANFWFVCHLLASNERQINVQLVRPPFHNWYGFGGLNQDGLVEAYINSILIDDLLSFDKLWIAYRNNDLDHLQQLSDSMAAKYPFLTAAVQAHLDRIPRNGELSRPEKTLKLLIKELNTAEFGPIFREFSKRESIYGFGDLQVKRIYDKLVNNSS